MKDYLYDVFLSFTGADRDLKNAVRLHLEGQGLRCYDSDLYCKGQFRADFCEALDRSRVYLMLLTDNLRNDPTVSGHGTAPLPRCGARATLPASWRRRGS